MLYCGLAGVLSAVLFISVFMIPSLFIRQVAALISPIALAVPALSMGLNAVMIASGFGLLLISLAVPSVALLYLLVDVMPVVAITYLFIRVYENKDQPTSINIGRILTVMTVICCALMAAFLYLFPYQLLSDDMGMNAVSLEDFFYQLFSAQLVLPQGVDPVAWDRVIRMIVGHFPAALFLSWLFRAIVCMIIAQWAVTKWDRMLRATPDYSRLEIPRWAILPLPFLLVALLVTSGSSKYVAANALSVMLTPFLFLGLAQVHLFARRFKQAGIVILIFFYLVFFSGYAYAMLLVSLLGIVEFFINYKLIKSKTLNLKE